jgi:hypothetical protein
MLKFFHFYVNLVVQKLEGRLMAGKLRWRRTSRRRRRRRGKVNVSTTGRQEANTKR